MTKSHNTMSQTLNDLNNKPKNLPPVQADHSTRKFTVPSGRIAAAGLRFQAWAEKLIVKASLNGDPYTYDPAVFPWVGEVSAEWKLIRAELDKVMLVRDQIPSFQDILKEAEAITKDDSWKTFFLSGIGMDCSENAKQCPETMRILQKIPGMKTAFFSILAPKKHIPAHRGAYNGLLRLHLGLQVPEPAEHCRIRIGNEFHHWNEGQPLIFDDTFNHEVWNDTDGYRVVLFIDFVRPLRQPWHWINNMILSIGALAPFMREAGNKQKKWEKKFYKK